MRCAVEAKFNCIVADQRPHSALPGEYDTTAIEEQLVRTAVPTLVRMHRLREPGYAQASSGGRQRLHEPFPFFFFFRK